jgi:hypothetical protein
VSRVGGAESAGLTRPATLNLQRAKDPFNRPQFKAAHRIKAEIPFRSGFAAISTIPLQAVKPRNLGEFITCLKLLSLPALRHVDRTRWLDTCHKRDGVGLRCPKVFVVQAGAKPTVRAGQQAEDTSDN